MDSIYLELIFVGKLVLATFLGGLVGFEREIRGKAAGLRTYAAVSMGACAFSLISSFGSTDGDPTRIAAQIVSGIGFLGAGVIWLSGDHTKGLTTAASLWVSASIGMAIAYDFYLLGSAITLVNFVLLGIHHTPLWGVMERIMGQIEADEAEGPKD